MKRLVVCLPGTTVDRWLSSWLPAVLVESVSPRQLPEALSYQDCVAAVLSLVPSTLKLWPAIRHSLVGRGVPVIILASLTVEAFRTLVGEREVRLAGLHILGIDDHPSDLRRSITGLFRGSELEQFLDHFGSSSRELAGLVDPIWLDLGGIRSLGDWADVARIAPTSLISRLESLGVQRPRRFLTWLRLLRAWPALHAGKKAASVALDVGYSAPPAFTRATRQYLGITPSMADKVSLESVIARAVADLVA